jgi:excisionase family DNA binding protein
MIEDGYRPPEGYLTMAQAQARLGISKPTLNRMVSRGDLETYRDPRNRRVRLVKAEDVEKLSEPVLEGKAAA